METFSSTDTKPFTKFNRCLTDWPAFEKAATSSEPHWFKDLLSLWRPSGLPSHADGLRLAIRNNYLNFYRLGQSMARVSCVSGELRADVHYKYVLGELTGCSGPLYLRLTAKGVFSQGSVVAPYEGLSTLNEWTEKAKKYVGEEKKLVDEFVEKNNNVIDMEMALPAWAGSNVAVRMDLVAIEDERVVFWEVKTVNDSRIRCKADYQENKLPEVLKQLHNYQNFLAEEQHVEQLRDAYQKTANLLVDLRRLADKVGLKHPLGAAIISAGKAQRLSVGKRAALAVVDLPSKGGWKSWKDSHERKLLGNIPMRVFAVPGPLKFEGAL